METNKQNTEEQKSNLQQRPESGREEQVKLGETSQREGQDEEDEADLNSLKGNPKPGDQRTTERK